MDEFAFHSYIMKCFPSLVNAFFFVFLHSPIPQAYYKTLHAFKTQTNLLCLLLSFSCTLSLFWSFFLEPQDMHTNYSFPCCKCSSRPGETSALQILMRDQSKLNIKILKNARVPFSMSVTDGETVHSKLLQLDAHCTKQARSSRLEILFTFLTGRPDTCHLSIAKRRPFVLSLSPVFFW